MAEKLQQIAWDLSRALCEAGSVAREPMLNTGESDVYGPEIIVPSDDNLNYYYFPSIDMLGNTNTGYSGISLLGVDDSALINISGIDGQSIIESIDSKITDMIDLFSPKFSDISINSLTTDDQTINIKNATSFKYIFDGADTLLDISLTLINISANDVEIDSITGDIVLTPSGVIVLAGDVELADHAFYLHGDDATDGSVRYKYDTGNIVFQWRESGSWVTKSTITP